MVPRCGGIVSANPQFFSSQSGQAADFIRQGIGTRTPTVGLILGTGLGGIADGCAEAISIPYADIPNFPAGAVSGHSGRLVIGALKNRQVAVLQGRVHYYEQGDAAAMRVPLEALARLGVTAVLLTNSAGSLQENLKPGWPVVIADHINWSGKNPLIGDPSDQRFVNMVDAYDPQLRIALKEAAKRVDIELVEGVYAWYSGPSFETPAEIRMAQRLGADLVGMSTVPEVILARRLGLRVAALSMVTNYGAGLVAGEVISHDQTKTVALQVVQRMTSLIEGFLCHPALETL